jgi:hypothetical protein
VEWILPLPPNGGTKAVSKNSQTVGDNAGSKSLHSRSTSNRLKLKTSESSAWEVAANARQFKLCVNYTLGVGILPITEYMSTVLEVQGV